MNSVERIEKIKTTLQHKFSPSHLEVLDDSAKHMGHAGAQGGAGHYTVIIAADCFATLSRVSVHREIYQALGALIPQEIHALQIKVLPNG